jgi:hypothetical protein
MPTALIDFCWAQFIGDDELRFAQKEENSLFDYQAEHKEVSDILMTGGDPMIMNTWNHFATPTFYLTSRISESVLAVSAFRSSVSR